MFDDIRPDALLTSVTVNAAETETAPTFGWSMAAHAICADA